MKYDTISYIISALIVVAIISFFGALIIFFYDQEITMYSLLPFAIFVVLAIIVVVMIFFAQIANGAANIGLTVGTTIAADIGANSNKSSRAAPDAPDAPAAQLLLQGPISIYNDTTATPSIQPPPQSSNYTISFWLYPNVSPQLNNFQIFKYGDSAPYITFGGPTNALRMFPSKQFVTKKQSTTITIPTQKWSYIVVQYIGGRSVQFYVNCNLIATVPFDQVNSPTYSTSDMMYVGNHNPAAIGIGAISNINYYTTPLTDTQIRNQYAILSTQVIPTGF